KTSLMRSPALTRYQNSGRIKGLPNELVGNDSQTGFIYKFRHGVFHLASPERGNQLAADAIQAIEHLPVLADHHQRKPSAGSQHTMDFPKRQANIFLGK